jgi:hypothetical protein
MASTYEPIATQTLGSSAASVTFSSISGSYTDLIIISQTGSGAPANGVYIRFNGDTSSIYSTTDLWGDGSSAASGRTSNQSLMRILGRGTGASNDLSNNSIAQIMNYSNTTTYKTMLVRANSPAYGVGATVGLWRSTSAVTAFTITAEGGNLPSGSSFTLYGIKSA